MDVIDRTAALQANCLHRESTSWKMVVKYEQYPDARRKRCVPYQYSNSIDQICEIRESVTPYVYDS